MYMYTQLTLTQVVWCALLRTILYLVITIMLASCAMFDMIVRSFLSMFNASVPSESANYFVFSASIKFACIMRFKGNVSFSLNAEI